MEPAHARIGRGPTINVFRGARDGAVVNYFAFFIAPAAVNYLSHGDFVDVASDHAVDQLGGVLAGQKIFVERGDVDHRGGVANRVVLMVVVHFVNAHGVIARPFAIIHALAKLRGSVVDGCSDRQSLLRYSYKMVSRWPQKAA